MNNFVLKRKDYGKEVKQKQVLLFFDRLSSNAINWLHALIFGYQEGYKCEMNRILDELVKRNRRIVLKRWQKGKNGRK